MQKEPQKEPLITIAIPTYNRHMKLKKALDSAVNQTYKILEIIIADNHSEYNTEELCKEYAAKDPRVKYFRHDENLGMTENANFLAHKVQGEYVFWLSDDDWLDLDFIEKCVDFITNNPDYAAIITSARLYEEDYTFKNESIKCKLNYGNLNKRIKKYIIKNGLTVCTGFLRTDILKQMLKEDHFFEKNRVFEDWVFFIKYLVAGKVAFLKTTYFHKLMGGWTKDFESTQELWGTDKLSANNFWDKLEETLLDSVNNDKFYDLYLNEKSKKKLIETIKKTIESEKKPSLIRYIKRNPYFLFTKGFWIRMKKRMKL